ncbi:hypothetical protein Tco_0540575 [Tanacetum coccineum]
MGTCIKRSYDSRVNEMTDDRRQMEKDYSSKALDANIPNQCESEQALNVSAGTLLSTELGIQDHNNEQTSSKLVLKVVPLAVKTDTSRQELELLFHHHIAMLRTTAQEKGKCTLQCAHP